MFHLSFVNNNSTNEDRLKKTNAKYNGPFRATQMWNDLVKTFKEGMPLQRHRKALKKYDNCFMASDAINWFLFYLKGSPEFMSTITRSQVELLLKKFYDAKVFEEVDKSKTGFQSGNKLYRFCDNENQSDITCLFQPSIPSSDLQSKPLKSFFKPNKTFSVNLKSSEPPRRNVPLKTLNTTCHSTPSNHSPSKNKHPPMDSRNVCVKNVHRPGHLSNISQGKDVVMKDFLKSLNSLVGHRDLSQLVYRIPGCIDNVIHNVSVINKNGIPTNIDKKDQLPLWFVTALKSLASGSLSEKLCGDTVDVVCDFIRLQGNESIVSKDLFSIIASAFGHVIEVDQRKSQQSQPVEHSNSWRDLYKLRFNWKKPDRSTNQDNHSRSVVSTMDSFDFIDSSTTTEGSSPLRKSIVNLKREDQTQSDVHVATHSPPKPLSFLGGMKQMKRNKKDKKLKNCNSLVVGQGEVFEDIKHPAQLSTSNRDLRHSGSEESSLRNGIRSEENLSTQESGGISTKFARDSQQVKKMIEILQHALLIVNPKQRRMLMILIRLLAKTKTTCQTPPHTVKLLDTFLKFIFTTHERKTSEVVTEKKIFNFMMEFYSDIFRVPKTVADAVIQFQSGDLNDKENLTLHSPVAKSFDKMADVSFPKSILKKPKIEAIRF